MRKAMLLGAAAAAFGLGTYASVLGPVLGAALLIALGVMLAVSASGSWNMLAVAAGAIAAFAAGVLRPVSPIVAAAIFLGACYAERSWRVRGHDKRALHVVLALVGGALAGAVAVHVLGSAWSVRLVGAVVCAVLAALPQLVDADDPLAFSLDAIADEVSSPAASHLRDGAELRRTVDEAVLDRSQTRQARKTWSSLLKLARARMRLEKSVATAKPTRAAAATAPPAATVASAAEPPPATKRQGAVASHAPATPTTPNFATAQCSAAATPAAAPRATAEPVAEPAAEEPNAATAPTSAPVQPSSQHGQAVVRRVDQRIAEHVQALARMYTAADAAKAAEMSLQDGPLRSVENTGESLEQMSQAFVEDV